MSNYINSIGPSGKPDGKVYAVNPSGHLVSVDLIPVKDAQRKPAGLGLKPGWRAATQADIDAAKASEAARGKVEAAKAAAQSAPEAVPAKPVPHSTGGSLVAQEG